jgi:hypothetical protein
MITLRSVFTRDAPLDYLGRVRSRDALLDVVPSGKLLVTPRTYEGEIKPKIEKLNEAESSPTFSTPFFPDRVLTAEPFPREAAWQPTLRSLGDLALEAEGEIVAAARVPPLPDLGDWNKHVDVTEIYEAVRAFRRIVGSLLEQNDTTAFQERLRRDVHDGRERIRDAAERVTGQLRAKARGTSDAARHPMIRGNSVPHGSWSRAVTPAEVNKLNRERWAPRSEAPTRDSAGAAETAAREHAAAASRARSEPERLRAIQRAHDAYWAAKLGER